LEKLHRKIEKFENVNDRGLFFFFDSLFAIYYNDDTFQRKRYTNIDIDARIASIANSLELQHNLHKQHKLLIGA